MDVDFAHIIKIIRETRQIILNRELSSTVHSKGEADFVTDVDLHVSNYLKEQLVSRYPDIVFCSEEDFPDEFTGIWWQNAPVSIGGEMNATPTPN